MKDPSFVLEYQHVKKSTLNASLLGMDLTQSESEFLAWFVANEDLDSVSKLASIITKARANHFNQF